MPQDQAYIVSLIIWYFIICISHFFRPFHSHHFQLVKESKNVEWKYFDLQNSLLQKECANYGLPLYLSRHDLL